MSTLGYWREPLTSLHVGASLSWKAPGPLGLQVWVGLLNGQAVARISRQPGHGKGCSAAIEGWMWTEQEPGSAAARLGVKESPTRGFASVPEAKRAIKVAMSAHRKQEMRLDMKLSAPRTKRQLIDFLAERRQELGGAVSDHNNRRLLATRKRVDLLAQYERIIENERMTDERSKCRD